MKRGTESALLPILCKGAIYLITVKGADPLPQYRITGLELTIERPHQIYPSQKAVVKEKHVLNKIHCGDFPAGPVAKTLCSQHRELEFDPWSGN